MGNGLRLYVFHDKAFELGLFTLDRHCNVYINPKGGDHASGVMRVLLPFNGCFIKRSPVAPLEGALFEHWARTGVIPYAEEFSNKVQHTAYSCTDGEQRQKISTDQFADGAKPSL